MRNLIFIAFLFASSYVVGQNPFQTKANAMMQFSVSPNEKMIVCSWWGSDGVSKIRVKDLTTGIVFDVDSVNMMEEGLMPFIGVSFISDNELIYSKDGSLLVYNIKGRNGSQLCELPEEQALYLSVSKSGRLLMALDGLIALCEPKKSIEKKEQLEKNSIVLSFSTTIQNLAIYCLGVKRENKTSVKIMSWDGKSEPIDLSDQFIKIIENPYIVKATQDRDVYVVVNKAGIYRFNVATQKAMKLLDSSETDPVVEIQLDQSGKKIYYRTNNHKATVSMLIVDKAPNSSIVFEE